MKIALCLSGQPRFFKQSFSFLKKNVLDVNKNIDIFIHTWKYSDGFKGKPFNGASWNECNTDIYLGHDETEKQLIDLYNPKDIQFSIIGDVLEKDWNSYPLSNGENLAKITHFMFFTIKKSVELTKLHNYDLIVRTRFDAAPLNEIDFSEFKEENNIYHTDSCRNPLVLSDWFFWSNQKNMLELCRVYDEIDDFVLNKNVMCCGEEILTYKLKQMELNRVPVQKSLCLVRDSLFKNKNFGKLW